MTFNDVFMIVPSSAGLSGAIWFVALMVILYMARNHAHKGIISFSEAIHNSFRLSARSVKLIRELLITRNRDVLLAQGREATERIIEREFERIDATVRKDLGDYPSLHRHLNEEITARDLEICDELDAENSVKCYLYIAEKLNDCLCPK